MCTSLLFLQRFSAAKSECNYFISAELQYKTLTWFFFLARFSTAPKKTWRADEYELMTEYSLLNTYSIYLYNVCIYVCFLRVELLMGYTKSCKKQCIPIYYVYYEEQTTRTEPSRSLNALFTLSWKKFLSNNKINDPCSKWDRVYVRKTKNTSNRNIFGLLILFE